MLDLLFYMCCVAFPSVNNNQTIYYFCRIEINKKKKEQTKSNNERKQVFYY